MNTQDKKDSIKNRVNELLKDSFVEAENLVNKAINSGAIDIDSWTPEYASWILPKIITTAILEKVSQNYQAKGTSFSKEVKKEIKNLKLFL